MKIIGIVGNGASGNSAVTDWLYDNADNNYKVIRGDFEELRMKGGWFDLLTPKSNNNRIDLSVLKKVAIHTLRVKVANFLYKTGMRQKSYYLYRRDDFSKIFKIYIYGVIFDLLKMSQVKKINAIKKYFSKISKCKILVLNNPIYLTKECLEELDKLELDIEFIFTHRKYEVQYVYWKKLDFRPLREKYIKIFNVELSGVEQFLQMQINNIDIQELLSQKHKTTDVNFENFVISKSYRDELRKKIFGLDENIERHIKFNPEKTMHDLALSIDNSIEYEDSILENFGILRNKINSRNGSC